MNRQAEIRDFKAILEKNAGKVAGGIIICDFCSADNARFCAVCPPFPVPGGTPGDISCVSGPDWAMCLDCAVLVYAKDARAVLDRAVNSFFIRHPTFRSTYGRKRARAHIQQLHGPFWQHHTGVLYDITDQDKRDIQLEIAQAHERNLKVIDNHES